LLLSREPLLPRFMLTWMNCFPANWRRTRRTYWILIVLLPPLPAAASPPRQPIRFDLIIRHGRIIDGTGLPWYSGDLGIRGGRIAAIGNLAQASAEHIIDAADDVVAPGFIDMLGQSELTIFVDPRLPSKIFQGITTEITGEGGSAAPLTEAIVNA